MDELTSCPTQTRSAVRAADATSVRLNYQGTGPWRSWKVPVGPSGKALSALAPSVREQLKTRLRERLPIAADGTIAYEAFANAVKGVVP